MAIDWFTFGAQMVNFVVLVVLLERFLYRPLLDVMNQRTQGIEARENAARQAQDEARQQAEASARERDEARQQATQLMAQATAAAEAARQALLEAAHRAVSEQESSWRESLRARQQAVTHQLQHQAGQQVLDAASRVLQDLADESLDVRVVESFCRRLTALQGEAREQLVTSCNGRVRLLSAHALPASSVAQVESTLGRLLGRDVKVRAEVDPQLTGGVELRAGSVRLDWNLRSYLETMRLDLERALEETA